MCQIYDPTGSFVRPVLLRLLRTACGPGPRPVRRPYATKLLRLSAFPRRPTWTACFRWSGRSMQSDHAYDVDFRLLYDCWASESRLRWQLGDHCWHLGAYADLVGLLPWLGLCICPGGSSNRRIVRRPSLELVVLGPAVSVAWSQHVLRAYCCNNSVMITVAHLKSTCFQPK